MSFKVPDRIHIMPVGFEGDRVYEAAEQYKADKVILIPHNDNNDLGQAHLEIIEDELTKRGIDFESRLCDIFDLYDSLGLIASVIREHEDEEVYVNIATGSKITAVAGTIACMVTGASAYYVKAKYYEGDSEDMDIEDILKLAPKGIENVIELPEYPIDAPEPNQVRTLRYIQTRNSEGKRPTKGELINFTEEANVPVMRKNVDGKGKYRLLDTYILDPLENDGYIKVIEDGRNRVVEITEEGKDAVKAFRYLIDEDDERIAAASS